MIISLDNIAKKGEPGIKILVERLYKDITLSGDILYAKNFGDFNISEWYKMRMVVEALGRTKAKSVIPSLTPILHSKCSESFFYEMLLPAVVEALGEIGGVEVIDHLRKIQEASDTPKNIRLAVNKALASASIPIYIHK